MKNSQILFFIVQGLRCSRNSERKDVQNSRHKRLPWLKKNGKRVISNHCDRNTWQRVDRNCSGDIESEPNSFILFIHELALEQFINEGLIESQIIAGKWEVSDSILVDTRKVPDYSCTSWIIGTQGKLSPIEIWNNHMFWYNRGQFALLTDAFFVIADR